MCAWCCGATPKEKRGRGHAGCSDDCYNVRQPRELRALREKLAAVKTLVETDMAETRESRARSARGNVRCLGCGLRYDERDQYGCGQEGYGHSYDEDELDEVMEAARAEPVEWVDLKVADVMEALGVPE